MLDKGNMTNWIINTSSAMFLFSMDWTEQPVMFDGNLDTREYGQ